MSMMGVKSRLVMAAAAAALALSTSGAWAIGGVIGGTYQDQVNKTAGTKNVTLNFKTNTQVVVVSGVSCQIQTAGPPPFEVSLSQSHAPGVLVFLPVTFVGQAGAKNVYSAFATGLAYGIAGGHSAEILARWPNNGSYDVICSIVGKRN